MKDGEKEDLQLRKSSFMKKTLSVALSLTMLASVLSGCSKNNNTENNTSESNNTTTEVTTGGTDTTEASGSSKYADFITVDVFDGQANFQGLQSGWFGCLYTACPGYDQAKYEPLVRYGRY